MRGKERIKKRLTAMKAEVKRSLALERAHGPYRAHGLSIAAKARVSELKWMLKIKD